MIDLSYITGFEWDEASRKSNWQRYHIEEGECHDVFFNLPLFVQTDLENIPVKRRSYILGQTLSGRKLFIAFTIHKDKIRIITARDMSKREQLLYDQANS
jgi:uncharacterized DUF497 family protein